MLMSAGYDDGGADAWFSRSTVLHKHHQIPSGTSYRLFSVV